MNGEPGFIRMKESVDRKRGLRTYEVYGMTISYPIGKPAHEVLHDIDRKVAMRQLKDEYVSWSN